MTELSTARRRLRSLIAAGTYHGQNDQVVHARTALATEKAREQVAALDMLSPAPAVEQVDRVVAEAERVRAWAAEQAASAPPIPPEVTHRISRALRSTEGGAA